MTAMIIPIYTRKNNNDYNGTQNVDRILKKTTTKKKMFVLHFEHRTFTVHNNDQHVICSRLTMSNNLQRKDKLQ